MSKQNRAIILLLSAVLNGALGCGSAPSTDTRVEPDALPAVTTLTPVTTGMAERKMFSHLIECNGKIRSLHEQLVNSEVSGKLLVCNAQTGRRVTSGAMILQLDTTAIQFRLKKANLAYFNTQKEYESQLLGYENLLKDKTAEKTIDIKQKIRISSGFAGSEQEIEEAKYELSKAGIRAPFAGVLAEVKVQQGQQVKEGDPLFRIYDPNNLLLEVKILEADIMALSPGIACSISPVSNPEQKYRAAVYEIDPYIDENGMATVKLKVDPVLPRAHSPSQAKNRNRQSLFPGMNCTAVIDLPGAETIVVPKNAVVYRSSKAVVFTLENGKAKWNYVTQGRENGNEIEVKAGLKAGQKIILSNNLQLSHDAPVKEVSGTGNH